jgi:hypothetical protein
MCESFFATLECGAARPLSLSLTANPASSSNRSVSVAYVPSICEVSKASLRIAPYSSQPTDGTRPVTPRTSVKVQCPATSFEANAIL